nr:zinc finger, CCHC-type [Tanacetum cinerariifolium]
ATVHVCKDTCWFKTYESLNDGSILHMGNKSTAPVHERGCVDLRLGHVHIKRMQDMSKDRTFSVMNETDGSGGVEELVARSKMSFHPTLNLILELDKAAVGCTQDILRQRDCLDQLSEVPWVVLTFVVTEGEVNGSSCDGIDMVIKNLDLEPKVDAMMRDFLYKETSTKILPCGDGSCWKTFKPVVSLIAKGKLKQTHARSFAVFTVKTGLHEMAMDAFESQYIVAGDGVAGIKRRRRDLYSDGVRNFMMASRRGRLKEDLESSTWRRRQDF